MATSSGPDYDYAPTIMRKIVSETVLSFTLDGSFLFPSSLGISKFCDDETCSITVVMSSIRDIFMELSRYIYITLIYNI